MKMVQKRAVSLVLASAVAISCIFSAAMVNTSAQDIQDAAEGDYIYVPASLYKYDRTVVKGSSAPAGMVINQATYDAARTAAAAAPHGTAIRALYFDNYVNGNYYGGDWDQNHPNGLYAGIVKSTLDENGNLQWASGRSSGQSYQYAAADLFGSGNEDTPSYRTDFSNLAFPLKKETGDNGRFTGYYSFNSENQRATLDQENKTISLSDQDIDDDSPQFCPFYSGKGNPAGEDRNQCFSFGMNMNMTFTIPASRQVWNESTQKYENMRFTFSGDDDVWIFVDGTLVLDLGGVHPAVTGTIDFKTLNWTTQIGGKSLGSGPFRYDAGLNQHTLTVYYLERGAGLSNFSMRCNLPQSSSLEVGKQLSGDRSAKDSGTYWFQAVYNGEDGAGLKAEKARLKTETDSGFEEGSGDLAAEAALLDAGDDGDSVPLARQSYSVYNISGGTYVKDSATDAEGVFSLKAGQKAVFSYTNSDTAAKLDGKRVKVTELGAEEYDTTWQTTVGSDVESGTDKEAEATAPPNDGSTQTSSIIFTNKLPTGITAPTKTATLTDATKRTYDITLRTSTKDASTSPTFSETTVGDAEGDDANANVMYYPDEVKADPIYWNDTTIHHYVWEYVSNNSQVSPAPTTATLYTKTTTSSTEYDPIYRRGLDTSETYYVKSGTSSYIKVTYQYDHSFLFWDYYYWKDASGNIYTPKSNKNDSGTQFYTATTASTDTYSCVSSVPTEPDGETYYVKSGSGYVAVYLADNSTTGKAWYDGTTNQVLATQPDAHMTIYEIDTDGTEAKPISGATVVDTIDPRFEVVDGNGNPVNAGDTVTTGTAADGATPVAATLSISSDREVLTWSDQEIPVEPSQWLQTVHIQAKPEFIGGNDIPTNVAGITGSYVSYRLDGGADVTKAFNQPRVNVPVRFNLDNRNDTIFLGEPAPSVTMEPYTLKADGTKATGGDMFCGQGDTGSFSYVWNPSPVGSSGNTFPENPNLTDTTVYTLTATFTPGGYGTASQGTGGGDPAAELSRTATYTVTVVKGELDLTKIMDHQYPVYDPDDGTAVNPQQSFVFKITRSDTNGGEITDTFYEVMTPGADGTGPKITGLKKGYYTVTEESDAWRYMPDPTDPVEDNDSSYSSGSLTDGIVFIGRDTSTGGGKSYFGAQTGTDQKNGGPHPATVQFKNDLTNRQWFGDTTVEKNTISN